MLSILKISAICLSVGFTLMVNAESASAAGHAVAAVRISPVRGVVSTAPVNTTSATATTTGTGTTTTAKTTVQMPLATANDPCAISVTQPYNPLANPTGINNVAYNAVPGMNTMPQGINMAPVAQPVIAPYVPPANENNIARELRLRREAAQAAQAATLAANTVNPTPTTVTNPTASLNGAKPGCPATPML